MNAEPGRPSLKDANRARRAAGRRLLQTYAALAGKGEHLLQGLLGGRPPMQWQHYPDDDAIDATGGYQWFYHSHSTEDRPGSAEHGHFHLFARRPLWARRLHSKDEKAFAALTGRPTHSVATRHLLAIGLDPKGVPSSLFTVNSWVTGDLMLSASATERLLRCMRLHTGYPHIDAVLECVIALCPDEIRNVLVARDQALSRRPAHDILTDESIEILSERAITLDDKLALVPSALAFRA